MNRPRSHPKAVVRNAFEAIINQGRTDTATIEQYIALGYIQKVDGKTLDYKGFVSHMQALSATVSSMQVTFDSLTAEDDKVASAHRVRATKTDGGAQIEIQVITLFQVAGGRIVSCNEPTHLISGSHEDRDLGSRT